MFEIGRSFYHELSAQAGPDANQIHARRYHQAVRRFKSILFEGQLMRLKKRLLRVRQSLYDLNLLRPQLTLGGSSYGGLKVVELNRIIGTEGRSTDFDSDFYPVSEKSRERWVNVALAYLDSLPLEPVELIEVGNAYFVRDGHHRISVARAFGQVAIDAEVVIWRAQSPFPWATDGMRIKMGEAIKRPTEIGQSPSGACCA